ncbi:MAG TPA: acetyl-coenzyme A synthetase N-terminal domain-containing protein, partial [Aquabacterium sp.]|nr:acetyl-coenzyme A synthetase N-terminal domain-containing protein [Aquabacterium sp.]
MDYAAVYRRSVADRDAFWRDQAYRIDWHRPFDQVCDYSQPPMAKWFVGGQTNLCHNAVDRHVPARPDQPALIHVSTETGEEQVLSFGQLHVEVQRMAAVLQSM